MGSKVIKTYPNLIQGISQQPPSLRSPGQGEAQENAVPSPSEGLKKRPGTEWVNTLANWPTVSTGEVQTHFIDRDSTERYVVVVGDQSQNGDSTLKVYDYADGSDNNIKDQNGDPAVSADFTYLDCTDPSKDLKLLTINDYTFIVNKTISPALTSATSTERRKEGLFVVNAGNYSITYTIHVYGTGFDRKVEFKTNNATNADNAQWISTDYIASKLAEALDNTGVTVNDNTDGATLTTTGTVLTTADWDISVEGSVIHIKRSDAWVAANPSDSPDFSLKATDGVGSTNTSVVKDVVQTYQELPTTAPNGFVIKVDGDPETSSGEYYAKFITNNEEDFGEGIWQETIAGGIQYKIDETTMPHLLIRLSNGDFLFTPATGDTYNVGGVDDVEVPAWADREVGDETSNPNPSFIGTTINDVFYFKDRLGFLADDATILSFAGNYFNFWRGTVIDLLDAARIDVRSTHTKVTNLYSAVPLGEQLVLFSDRTQFSLRGETTLTPKTVAITPVSEHTLYKDISPIPVGSSIFMASERGDFSVVRELVDASQNRPKFEIVDIMAYIPSYIEGAIVNMAASTTEDMVAVVGNTDRSKLYVFNFFNNGGERVQSAWSRFTFGGDIIHLSTVGTKINLVIKRGTEFDLETIEMQPFATDTGSSYKTLLDRRVSETQLTSAVYDSGTNTTTLTLPYTVPVSNTMRVVKTNGQVLPEVSSTTTTIVVSGNHSATTLYVGETYDMLYEFSPVDLKLTGINRGLQSSASGTFHLSWGHLIYEDSAYFDVEVTLKNQTPSTYTYTGYTVGGAGSVIGSISLLDGIFKFGLLGPAKDVTVKIKSDSHFPCRLISAEFEGFYRGRGQRL